MYIWQQSKWPEFTWQAELLQSRLDRVRLLQGRLQGQSDALPKGADRQAEMDALIQNAIRTSEIEGEELNVESVRSSVARHLGLEQAGIGPVSRKADCLVELLLDATRRFDQPLSAERLCAWQAALFPEPSPLQPINIGALRGPAPMQVVSGRIDRPRVHFEAPPRESLEAELDRLLAWYNQPPEGLDGLLRAGLVHLWLVTLHPFDDGNGRIARAVTDMALAQAERQSIRFYSMSAAIMARRREYYAQLESAQKDDLDVTAWLVWFLSVLEDALEQALARFARVLRKAGFWQRHAQSALSPRQIKVLNRMLDNAGEEFADGISARHYQALAKVSKATATRELSDLVDKGCLAKLPGGGRSTRYAIADPRG